MMSVCRAAAADKTRLLGNQSYVIAVANPPRCRQRQHAFVYWGCSPSLCAPTLIREPRFRGEAICSLGHNTRQSRLESLLDAPGIRRYQSIFGATTPVSPICSFLVRLNLSDFGDELVTKIAREIKFLFELKII
jgi:hypothetical protein